MAKIPTVTPQALRQVLRYESESGRLFWKSRSASLFPQKSNRTPEHSAAIWNRRYSGEETFMFVQSNGYLSGQVFKHKFLSHRVAWALFYEFWPKGEIDHINGCRSDNRISNLREVSRTENCINRGPNSGRRFKGVYRKKGSWICQMNIGGKSTHIGSYETELEAAAAYNEVSKRIHGEYACLNNTDWIAPTQDRLNR